MHDCHLKTPSHISTFLPFLRFAIQNTWSNMMCQELPCLIHYNQICAVGIGETFIVTYFALLDVTRRHVELLHQSGVCHNLKSMHVYIAIATDGRLIVCFKWFRAQDKAILNKCTIYFEIFIRSCKESRVSIFSCLSRKASLLLERKAVKLCENSCRGLSNCCDLSRLCCQGVNWLLELSHEKHLCNQMFGLYKDKMLGH